MANILYKGKSEITGYWVEPPAPEPGSILWTPSYSTNTDIWLDAKNIDTVILASGVSSQWLDVSGNGNHAQQASASSRPGYSSGEYLTFDGVNDGFFVPAYTRSSRANNPQMSFFGVASFTVDSTFRSVFSFDGVVGGYNRGLGFESSFGLVAQGGSDTNDIRVTPPSGFFVFAVVYDYLGNYFLRVNGTQTARGFSETGDGAFGQQLTVGFGFPASVSGNSQNFNGQMSEFLVVRGDVSLATTELNEGYLAHKWDLDGLLAGGHSYKTNPPLAL